LAPVAVPLFVVSAVLLIVGALACSRLATICALGGCALAYVGMFVLADGASMSGMEAMAPSSTVSKAVFSVGAALIVATMLLRAGVPVKVVAHRYWPPSADNGVPPRRGGITGTSTQKLTVSERSSFASLRSGSFRRLGYGELEYALSMSG